MLFITVKSAEATHVPKVLQVVEQTKRIRHKAGEQVLVEALVDPTELCLQDCRTNKIYTSTFSMIPNLRKRDLAESTWMARTRTRTNMYLQTA